MLGDAQRVRFMVRVPVRIGRSPHGLADSADRRCIGNPRSSSEVPATPPVRRVVVLELRC